MRGLWKLIGLELKIFAREPLGLVGALLVPAVIVVGLGRAFTGAARVAPRLGSFVAVDLPVLAAMMIALNTVLSLVTIISIYREGGILKRLRATPLRPWTILSAQVLVKLLLTAVSMTAMVLAGRRYFAIGADVPLFSFGIALLISTLSILSLGFIVASIVPTARFAQPVGAVIFYPMLAFSGLFYPISGFPPGMRFVANLLPLGHSASLMKGIWIGEPWSAHLGDVGALLATFVVCVAISARVFKWE